MVILKLAVSAVACYVPALPIAAAAVYCATPIAVTNPPNEAISVAVMAVVNTAMDDTSTLSISNTLSKQTIGIGYCIISCLFLEETY